MYDSTFPFSLCLSLWSNRLSFPPPPFLLSASQSMLVYTVLSFWYLILDCWNLIVSDDIHATDPIIYLFMQMSFFLPLLSSLGDFFLDENEYLDHMISLHQCLLWFLPHIEHRPREKPNHTMWYEQTTRACSKEYIFTQVKDKCDRMVWQNRRECNSYRLQYVNVWLGKSFVARERKGEKWPIMYKSVYKCLGGRDRVSR